MRYPLKRLSLLLSVMVVSSALAACDRLASSPKLYVMDCGYLSVPDVAAFGLSNEDTPVRELFVPCYLIEHKGKTMLWDAGLPLTAVGQGQVEMDSLPHAHMRYDVSIVEQLAQIDITPESVDYIAMSHLHFDHSGAANLFTEATWLVQRSEHAMAFGDTVHATFDPTLYGVLQNSDTRLLDGDYDVFGDGKVQLISAPGHTPGHMVLLLDLTETGKLVLSGDLYHFRASRVLQSVPTFNNNAENTRRSMAKVEKLIADNGATLWIGHDMALARTLKKAPSFYR